MSIDRTRERVFVFLVQYKKAHNGNSPSTKDIMDNCGLSSTSVVHYHLESLVHEKRIERDGVRGIIIPGSEWIFHEEYIQPVVDKEV